MFEFSSLERALAGIGIVADVDIFTELDSKYGERSRHYHSRSHVAECLLQLCRFNHLAQRIHEIEVAIWFHDAIYDTHRNDNEEKSAEWASRYLRLNGAEGECTRRISDMIIATKTHAASDKDALLLLDIDLGILGASASTFEAYDSAIRKEYHWVPEEQYRKGRREVLEAFLARDNIYQTDPIRKQYEAIARENLTRKISELRS